MKKNLLTIAALALAGFSFSQPFTDGVKGYTQDYNGSSCAKSSGSKHFLFAGTGVLLADVTMNTTAGQLEIMSNKEDQQAAGPNAGAAIFGLLYTNGEVCDFMHPTGSVDVSEHKFARLVAKADAPMTLSVFFTEVAKSGAYPAITKTVDLALTTEFSRFIIPIDGTTKVNSFGFFFNPGPKDGANTGYQGKVYIQSVILANDFVATEKSSSVSELNVFPNPANDVINFTYNVTRGNNVSVQLVNTLGSVVSTSNGSLSSASLNVSGVDAGMYIANVIVDGVIASSQTVVVE